MKNSSILLMLNSETDDKYIENFARVALNENIHVSCFLLSAGVAMPPMIYGASLYGTIDISDNWQQLLNEALAKQHKRVEKIEQILAQVGGSADVQSILCSPADTSDHIARRAGVCDLAVLAPSLRAPAQYFNEAAYGILYQSPIGLMANAMPNLNVKHVLIAWDGSHSASSAVHRALPYLKEADEVTVACFDPMTSRAGTGADPGADLASWLSHHGCRVTVSQEPSGVKEIATCIQDRARELGADLVVMGAYGHSRLIQAVFGGTTRAMLEQVELPILMAH